MSFGISNQPVVVGSDPHGFSRQSSSNYLDVSLDFRVLETVGFELVKACKAACSEAGVLLKVIIETGELKEEALIRKASEIAIDAGADFIKTSTGKVPVNATPDVAEIMMRVIADKGVKAQVGFKPAGGVRTADDAAIYLKLADDILGSGWADARHFRFGASSLLASLLNTAGFSGATSDSKY